MAKVDVGDRAPDFELPGTGGRTYRLSDYVGAGKSGVILAFYPGDFTPNCTKQFCSYRDDAEGLDALGAPLLGISPQSVDSHERWAEERRLNVPLLADEDMEVAAAYGVKGWASPLAWLAERKAVTPGGFFIQRAIIAIDGEGVVRHRVTSFTGASYESVDDLRPVAEKLGATASASS
ncbi:MAG TPA: peroxiredoxin [Solirubrobacterales bacterium]